MNKQDLIRKIKEIEALTSQEKSELIELVNTQKRYGLVWEDKSETVEDELREKLPVLVEVKERAILAENLIDEISEEKATELFSGEEVQKPNPPNHILIEGDNLHALTVLNYTHSSMIDVIYIDPPYNTGNNDFKYNDRFVEKEDSYRHSKWLSFMSKRLRLARSLLKDSGIIFISINDIENSQLKLLCNEIFGEENFISNMIWHSRQNVDSRSLNGASNDHEYVLCFSKHSDSRIRGKIINTNKYTNPDNDPRGTWMSSPIDGLATKENRPNLHYTIINSETGKEYNPSPATGWRFQKSTLEQMIIEKRIIWPRNPNSKPRMKRYLNELLNQFTGFSSILNVDFTTQGTNELRIIMGEETLKFPKPISLIKSLIEQSLSINSIILDFFAGSGTTLHATMQLNLEDGGSRQCILVTNNENDIAEEVCYERNKKVIQGYTKPNGDKVAGLKNNNFRYYKTDYVGRDKTAYNRKKLTELATDMLCIKEDCYNSITNDKLRITKGKIKLFENDSIFMMIVLDEDYIEQSIKIIQELHKKVKVYIFAPGQYPFTDDFEEVIDKVELCALPEAIYKAYKSILPKKKTEPLINTDLNESNDLEARYE